MITKVSNTHPILYNFTTVQCAPTPSKHSEYRPTEQQSTRGRKDKLNSYENFAWPSIMVALVHIKIQ